MKRNYNLKKTISIKMFIAEFGENFSKHMKKRLMDLEVRSVLTRKDYDYSLTLKHVEHTTYDYEEVIDGELTTCKKEYVFGQLKVIDGILYFSKKSTEGLNEMEPNQISLIFDNLQNDYSIVDCDDICKKIDDSNIDYLINSLLEVFPDVSQRYLDIIKEMTTYTSK